MHKITLAVVACAWAVFPLVAFGVDDLSKEAEIQARCTQETNEIRDALRANPDTRSVLERTSAKVCQAIQDDFWNNLNSNERTYLKNPLPEGQYPRKFPAQFDGDLRKKFSTAVSSHAGNCSPSDDRLMDYLDCGIDARFSHDYDKGWHPFWEDLVSRDVVTEGTFGHLDSSFNGLETCHAESKDINPGSSDMIITIVSKACTTRFFGDAFDFKDKHTSYLMIHYKDKSRPPLRSPGADLDGEDSPKDQVSDFSTLLMALQARCVKDGTAKVLQDAARDMKYQGELGINLNRYDPEEVRPRDDAPAN